LIFIRHRVKLINLIILASEQALSQWETLPEEKIDQLEKESPALPKIMQAEAKPFFRAARLYFTDPVTYIESNRGFEGFTFKMMKTDYTQQKVLHNLTERLETGQKPPEGQDPRQPQPKEDKKLFGLKSPFRL